MFDTLAQIHLMRGSYEQAGEYLRMASEAYGAYGTQTMRWYEWSLKVLGVKLAIRRGAFDEALQMADELVVAAGIPPSESIQAELAGCEALSPRGASTRPNSGWMRARAGSTAQDAGELGRVPSHPGHAPRAAAAALGRLTTTSLRAPTSSTCSASGTRRRSASSRLGRLAAKGGARSTAQRYLDLASAVFTMLGAQRDLDEVIAARDVLSRTADAPVPVLPADADEATVRRLVEAAMFPELLARETATALLESTEADASVVFVAGSGGELRLLASAGCDATLARDIAERRLSRRPRTRRLPDPHRAARQGSRWQRDSAPSSWPGGSRRKSKHRLRMFASVARQGFELCGARERPPQAADSSGERSLEPLLPGFICASGAMSRVAEQIQRFQGHNLTVLITGESGTGKDLVARAIHVGSPRSAAMFLPYNCTTTTRELADSQLFGHRRGSFTGAVTDQQGLIRSAAAGTLFLDEIGDLPLDVQPKLLRFLEQGEVMPVGETRPQAVDVRVLAATNADLEQRVAEGKFREDLYYRLSVIRIHVPSLRERREEIPHLSTFFLRDACERLSKRDIQLSSVTLDLFARYWWPGNVRQLRNEVQRAVAMVPPGGTIEPEHLSADLTAPSASDGSAFPGATVAPRLEPGNLAEAVEQVERQLITTTLQRTGGNISETARVLGLTRRGLYLKMRRLGLEGVPAGI